MSIIDLHMHSIVSGDGEFELPVLFQKCKDAQLSFIALSDHNSISGVLQLQALDLGDVQLIAAIELDVMFEGLPFHLLGYGIDLQHPKYQEIHSFILKQEQEASKHIIQYARYVLGLHFLDQDIENMSKDGVVNAEMVMAACLKQPSNQNNKFMIPYLQGGTRSDNPMVNFYWDHFSNGQGGYVAMNFPPMQQLISFLHEQGAIAVLAHPGNNAKEDIELLEKIVALGIDGLEVYSSYHTTIQQDFYHEFATKHHLMETCGSDFHGESKPSITLGQHQMPMDKQHLLVQQLKKLAYLQ